MKIPHSLALLLLLHAPLAAQAGGIAGTHGPTVCTAYESNPLIFRARVLETSAIPLPPNTGASNPLANVRLQVLEVFKGDPGPEVTVLGAVEMFGKGDEFLVYADPPVSPHPPLISTTPVSQIHARTGPVTAPYAAADLAWLRAYPTAPPTASIFGSISMGSPATDIPTISVSLTGPATLTKATGADHTYAFKDLPPGAYTVTAVLPAGYTTTRAKNAAAVTVAAKGCAEVDFLVRHDATSPAPSPTAIPQPQPAR